MGGPPGNIRPGPGGGPGARVAGPPPRIGMPYQSANILPTPPPPPTMMRPPQQPPTANNSQTRAAPDPNMLLPTGVC